MRYSLSNWAVHEMGRPIIGAIDRDAIDEWRKWNHASIAPDPRPAITRPAEEACARGTASWLHKKPGAGLLLRLAGLAILCVATAAFYGLHRLTHIGQIYPATSLEYCLATTGFACTSAGSALLFWGSHLFDRVTISERWKPRP